MNRKNRRAGHSGHYVQMLAHARGWRRVQSPAGWRHPQFGFVEQLHPSGPWIHDGECFRTLEDVILYHVDAVPAPEAQPE